MAWFEFRKKRGFKGWLIRFRTPVLITIAAIIVIRLLLPYVILYFANKKLAHLDGYYGHIDDIDLALIRGAYVIDEVYINKIDSVKNDTTEFFSAEKIDLSVDWNALFDGKIVGEVKFKTAELTFTKDKTVGKKAEDDTTDFIQLVKEFMPLRINRFEVNNSIIKYADYTRNPKVELNCTDVYILGLGLTNTPAQGKELPASINFRSNLYGGKIAINVNLDPLSKVPLFDLDGDMNNVDLVNFNDLFKAYANFDVKKGRMGVYTEIATRNYQVEGYVKPIITDLDVVQLNKEEGKPLQIAWEALIGTVAEVFQNQPKEQLAARIEIRGKLTKPDISVLSAIITVLHNAFIEALRSSVENSVSLSEVGAEEDKNGKKKKKLKLFNRDKDEDK